MGRAAAVVDAPKLNIKGTRLLAETLTNEDKVLSHEGGTGSSKTVSIAQAHLIWSFQEYGKTYSVVRKTLPALRRGALKDFQMALALAAAEDLFLWSERDMSYTNLQTGTLIEFFSLDNPQKARGPRRDRLWCNEANELTEEDWSQLSKRTRGRIVVDYNPSMRKHWLYDKVLPRVDCRRVHSTYLDNAFLTDDNVREIELDAPTYRLTPQELHDLGLSGKPPEKGVFENGVFTDWDGTYKGKGQLLSGDPFRWAVFGLGLRGSPSEAIYPVVYESEGLTPGRQRRLGLDFGFNHPTVLVDLEYRDRAGRSELHIDELIHQSYLTSEDLVKQLPLVGVHKRDLITADGARPEMIEDIRRAGYNVVAAEKGPGSVKDGIDKLQTVNLCFTRRSVKSKDQFLDYRWKKTSSGEILDEPIKHEDDAPDAARYGGAALIVLRNTKRRRPAPAMLVQ